MKNGFIFDGVDIENLGLEYAPELSQTYVYGGAQIKNHEENFDGSDGAYYYGNTVQPKDFKLRCIFEGKHLNSGVMLNIEGVFRRGHTGKLIFKNRPWCYYVATVIAPVTFSDLKSYQSGIQTISLRAYYPFARCDQLYYRLDDPNRESIKNNTGILLYSDPVERCTRTIFTMSNATNPIRELIIYNGGTEYADLTIKVSGSISSGIEIINRTTNESCKVIGQTKKNTTNVGEKWVLDSLNGKAVFENTNTGEVTDAYIHHDEGFIRLAPGTPSFKNVLVKKAKNIAGDGDFGFEFVTENEDGTYETKYNAIPNNFADGHHCVIVHTNTHNNDGVVTTDGIFRINGIYNNNSKMRVDRVIISGQAGGTSTNTSINNDYNIDDLFNNDEVIDVNLVRVNNIVINKLGDTLGSVTVEFNFKPTFA